jgi:hypothetical protein
LTGKPPVICLKDLAFKWSLYPVSELLQSEPETVIQKVQMLCNETKGLPYILSGGYEIPAAVSDEVFQAFCNATGK